MTRKDHVGYYIEQQNGQWWWFPLLLLLLELRSLALLNISLVAMLNGITMSSAYNAVKNLSSVSYVVSFLAS